MNSGEEDENFERTRLTREGMQGLSEGNASDFAPGDIIDGDYEVLSFIGAGGMGSVYRVRHRIMNTEYALKTLRADQVTEVAWRRFQNEAQAIARMNHPNVVAIYNLGLHNKTVPYYVMDLLSGSTLADILQTRHQLPVVEALPIFIEACAGIGYAHKKGIVHRDIKPGNIVVLEKPDATGAKIKIVDFGIAKLSHTKDLANQQLTGVGEICGSPFYMSPEQSQAGKVDARSDIYSLGCTLFETLTGSPPFKGRNVTETMIMHHSNQPPTLSETAQEQAFPAALEEAVAVTLAKAPMDRYPNMEKL
ncbi:MAG: serine/threonine protein kinase, partial [Cyanobacteria bacterium SZAS LIN-2]|nr:serine/threonine protein kinase [Cyanobacteria bacterium SZAS LIN-2]